MRAPAAPWLAVSHGTLPEVQLRTPQGELVCTVPVDPLAPAQGEAAALMLRASPSMLGALEQVEEWWLTRGMHVFGAAPPCIRRVREAIHEATQP